MRRRALLSAPALLLSTWAEPAGRIVPAPDRPGAGPSPATGALIYAHGSYGGDGPPPDPPAWLHPPATWDEWRFERRVAGMGNDPLDPGGAELAAATRALAARGYRRIVLAGHSRGAFLALAALAHTPQTEALLLVNPAAHGTSPVRRPQALAEYRAFLDRAPPGVLTRLALVQFADDPFEPDLATRAEATRGAAARIGARFRLVVEIVGGHGGAFDPPFAAEHGAALMDFTLGA